MNRRLLLQACVTFSLALTPFGWVAYEYWQSCHQPEIKYERFMETVAPKQEELPQEHTHERRKIVKQMWFRPLENGANLFLYADRSLLTLDHSGGRMKAKEQLFEITCGFQDRLELNIREEWATGWMLRIMRSKSASFDYVKQQLEAQQVALELYRLKERITLSQGALPEPSQAAIAGIAEQVKIDCRTRPPRFRALRFRAHIKPPQTL